MEENRLTPMGEYDPKLFNELYKSTSQLRKKLAYQIDSRRLGVDYQEILSWFDVKFIFVFNKYVKTHEKEELKAHLIKALQFFKNRILRKAYSKSNIHNSMIDIEEVYSLKETHIEHEYDERQLFLGLIMEFMENSLSSEAYRILEIELNPPLFILNELSKTNYSTTKIPSSIIADYLGWGISKEAVQRVESLRKELRQAINEARMYFNNVHANI